jgi:F0F1-type ATP synthase assembly protein I
MSRQITTAEFIATVAIGAYLAWLLGRFMRWFDGIDK